MLYRNAVEINKVIFQYLLININIVGKKTIPNVLQITYNFKISILFMLISIKALYGLKQFLLLLIKTFLNNLIDLFHTISYSHQFTCTLRLNPAHTFLCISNMQNTTTTDVYSCTRSAHPYVFIRK